MTKDIKQRQSIIKNIKTFDHVDSFKRNLRYPDIKTKYQCEERTEQTNDSNEGNASESVINSSKKVILQEFYSGRNIHKKSSSIREKRADRKGTEDYDKHLKGVVKKDEITNCREGKSPSKRMAYSDIEVSEQKKDIKTRASKEIKKTNSLSIKQSNAMESKVPLNSSHVTYKIKTRDSQHSSLVTCNETAKIFEHKISNISKYKAVNKIPEKKGIKKIFLNMKKSVQKAVRLMKSLTTLLSIGASSFVFVIILICIVCIIVSSPFSIFFSNDSESGDYSLQHAIVEVNKEYNKKIRDIKAQYEDVIQTNTIINNDKEMRMRDVWQNVLLVYTIRTYEKDRNSLYFDNQRIKELQEVFFQCVSISGSLSESEEKKILTVNVTVKLYSEIAFTDNEQKMLNDLMDGKNNYLWNNILDGISIGNGTMVDTALAEVGNVGGQPYWSWYGFNSRVEWCACFVSWVAEQNGYIELGVIPKFASVEGEGIPWFQKNNQWEKRGYEPSSGDIVFFDWDNDDYADHVGIVEKSENGIVYTIEGNSIGDECRQRNYPIDSIYIKGYGIPNY